MFVFFWIGDISTTYNRLIIGAEYETLCQAHYTQMLSDGVPIEIEIMRFEKEIATIQSTRK